MKFKKRSLFLFITIQILAVGCKNTATKMNSFVLSYNRDIGRYTNSIITYSEAESLFKEKTIKIKFLTSFSSEDVKSGIMNTLSQSVFSQLLAKEELSRELINEGVTFQVLFLTKNAVVFSTLLVDKNELSKLDNESKNNIKENANKNPSNYLNSNSPNQVLAMLNKNLPIVNKETGFTILKIDINKKNELVYEIKVPNNLAKRMKGKDAADIVKDDMLRGDTAGKLFSSVSKFNIKVIKYKYKDEQDQFLNEVILTTNDLH